MLFLQNRKSVQFCDPFRSNTNQNWQVKTNKNGSPETRAAVFPVRKAGELIDDGLYLHCGTHAFCDGADLF
jgi:hypothetical protein